MKEITHNYLTGEKAHRKLNNLARAKKGSRSDTLHEWWISPLHQDGIEAPFQFCSISGDVIGEAGDASCLTSVHSYNGHAQTDKLTNAIKDDLLIPTDINAMAAYPKAKFIETWNHMVDCQEQMRVGTYPGLEGSWLEEKPTC